MSATEEAIVDDVLEVEPADEVKFATNYNEWSNPLLVVDATEPIEWDVPLGENWYTRDLQLQTERGTQYLVEFRSHDRSRCHTLTDGEKSSHQGFLRRLERIGSIDENQSGTTTEDVSTSDVDSESEAEADVLEEDAADDAPGPSAEYLETVNEVLDGDVVFDETGAEEDAGDDVQEGEDDADPITVDAVDEPDDLGVDLPDGVTAANIEAAVDEHETLGDVGEAIGVTRGRARMITVSLGCYGDVEDLPAGGRGQLTVTGWLAYAAVCLLALGAAFAISTGVIVP